MSSKIFLYPAMFLTFCLSFVGTAWASNEVLPTDQSVLDLAKPVWDAIHGGQYWLAAMFAIILLVALLNKYAPKIPVVGSKIQTFLDGDYGKPLSVLLVSFATSATAALVAAGPGAALSLAMAFAALKLAMAAAGGYELIKQLLIPLVAKIGAKAPAWMKPGFDLLLWVFSHKTDVIADAEKAGDAAVAATPATGAPKSDVTEI